MAKQLLSDTTQPTDGRIREKRWWHKEHEGEELAGKVFARLAELDQDFGQTRRKWNAKWTSMYENRNVTGSLPGEYTAVSETVGELVVNAALSVVDTLDSKTATVKPRPKPLTSGGDWEDQRKARGLEKLIVGTMLGEGIYTTALDASRDAKICDIGVIKVVAEEDGICCERVDPDSIFVDEAAATAAPPRELLQREFLPTDVLAANYEEQAEDILKSGTPNLKTTKGGADLTEVVEAWHLPSKEGGKDGRHVIAVSKTVLVDEPWDDDEFPLHFIRWGKRRKGFFGQGLVEQVSGLQEEATIQVRKIRDAHELLGVPFVLEPDTAEIAQGHITNRLGERVKFRGDRPPTVQVHQILAPEVYRHLDWILEKIYEISGVSVLSASSKLPSGLNQPSGIALQTYLDTESKRFASWMEEYSNFFLSIAKGIVKAARRLAKRDKSFSAKFCEKTHFTKIDFADVDLDDDRYVMQLWAVSLLPDSPAGKLAWVESMITIGILDPDEALSLLPYPDVEALLELRNASIEDVKMLIEHFLDGGEYFEPQKYQNLKIGIRLMQGATVRARMQKAPEDAVAKMEKWMEEADALLQEEQERMAALAAASKPPAAGPGPAAPPAGGPPMPPPMPEQPAEAGEMMTPPMPGA